MATWANFWLGIWGLEEHVVRKACLCVFTTDAASQQVQPARKVLACLRVTGFLPFFASDGTAESIKPGRSPASCVADKRAGLEAPRLCARTHRWRPPVPDVLASLASSGPWDTAVQAAHQATQACTR